MSGYFRVSRALFDPSHDLHPVTSGDPACHAFAWIDLIAMARWQDGGGVKRGQIRASIRFLGARWNRSNGWVLRFLNVLETEHRIERHGERSTERTPSVITVCNYTAYQGGDSVDGTPHGTPNGTPRGTRVDTRTGTRTGTKKKKEEEEGINPLTTTARASLKKWLCEFCGHVDLLQNDLAVMSIQGLYLPSGTDERVWGSTAKSDRPQMLATAILRWSGEDHTNFNQRLFRRIIETVIQEGQNGESRRSGPSAKVGQAAGGYIIPANQGAFKKYVDGDQEF